MIRAARQAGPDTIVVRYEDLVQQPVTIRRALSGFLGVDLLDGAAGGDDTVLSSHRTSQSAAASIGRWREDLTPEQIRDCDLAFGPSMRAFDYEPDKTRGRSSCAAGKADKPTVLAAEGVMGVSNLLRDEPFDRGSRQVMELTFGRNGSGGPFLLDGWSDPELDFVWSRAEESHLRLPAIRRDGSYRLRLTALPFTHGEALPAQRVTILLNGEAAGSARMRDVCALVVPVPDALARTGQAMTLSFRFPDAARPTDVVGGTDSRLLGFALYRIALIRIDKRQRANDETLGRPVPYVGAPVETPPILAERWRTGVEA